jgi:hypothetical protein
MFLKTYTELPVEFEVVRAALLRHPRTWLEGTAAEAERHAGALLVDVGLELHGQELTRRARLELGSPIATDRVVSLPLRLRAERHAGLFPALEGTLDAAWLGPGRTHLALAAQYEPPFGAAGRVADRALLHRVAEAVARRLLSAIVQGVTMEAAAGGNGRGGAIAPGCR